MIDNKKKELRKKVKSLKAGYSLFDNKSKSVNVLSQIENDPDFVSSKIVFAYWSLTDEVHTHEFIEKWYHTKQILLPVIVGDTLILRTYMGCERMKMESNYKILEPTTDDFYDLSTIDYVLVPGVAFDYNNSRMGRGKAFYDKLLISIKAKKVGVCFDFQMFDEIPTDKYDVRMDEVVFG